MASLTAFMRRMVTMALALTLSSGSALLVVCEMLCEAPVAAGQGLAASHATHATDADQAVALSHDHHAAPGAPSHHAVTPTTDSTERTEVARLRRVHPRGACCEAAATLVPTLIAPRAESVSLVATAQAGDVPVPNARVMGVAAIESPPDQPPPQSRSPLVLRI